MATTTQRAKRSKDDYRRMTRDELTDMQVMLHSLGDGQWNAPSLCEGWKVRHVIGHMCLGASTNPLMLPILAAPYGFNIAKASGRESFRYGDEHSPAELLDVFDRLVCGPKLAGLAKVAPPHEFFVDKVIHNQDIRRPLGLAREIPAERLVAALDVLPRLGGFLKSKRHTRGLRFVATDVGHEVGDGPEVRGAAEALILAMSGRPVSLPELSGEGVEILRSRIAA
jgi:uncharacterized protein (TIGR03083 family)